MRRQFPSYMLKTVSAWAHSQHLLVCLFFFSTVITDLPSSNKFDIVELSSFIFFRYIDFSSVIFNEFVGRHKEHAVDKFIGTNSHLYLVHPPALYSISWWRSVPFFLSLLIEWVIGFDKEIHTYYTGARTVCLFNCLENYFIFQGQRFGRTFK